MEEKEKNEENKEKKDRKRQERIGRGWRWLFLAACLLLCLLPFAGMAVAPTMETTENREMASFPSFSKDGGWNREWLSEAGAYFEDHFAFRPFFVAADSRIQGNLFQVSNVDTVIMGTDGWLYYKATLNDFLGQDLLSERAAYNIAHNLELIGEFVESQGGAFLFAVPPNKNTLYGEHMPYYYEKKAGSGKNIDTLNPYLEKMDIPYADLFSLFEGEEETLYLKRDSHWNQKGALLAYNTLMDALGQEHETFETVKAIRTKTEYGDLNKMIYPKWAVPEWNSHYEYQWSYQYGTDTLSVEDAWIEASCPEGKGSLLMFRDSFGNTLLPFLANAFEKSCFSKGEPYQIGKYMEEYKPGTVVLEKVERNLADLAKEPPIMAGPTAELEGEPASQKTATTLSVGESEYDSDYLELQGDIDPDYLETETDIFVAIRQGKKTTVYKASHISDGERDSGYCLYLPKTTVAGNSFTATVVTETDGQLTEVKTGECEAMEE